jgi:hypothetical protein
VSLLILAFLCCFLYWIHFGFKIDLTGKITALLTDKRVDAGGGLGIPRTTWDARKGLVHSQVTPASGEN